MINSNNELLNYSYTVETFSVFKNVDNSILGLNPILKKFGYEFVNITLTELENNFCTLFGLQKDFERKIQATIQNLNITISNEFLEAYGASRIFGNPIFTFSEHIFLKRIENFTQIVENHNIINQTEGNEVFNEISNFTKALIQQLRLFKNGDIDSEIQFQISKLTRNVQQSTRGNLGRTFKLTNYILTANETDKLIKSLKNNFEVNKLTEIAIENFNLSYSISDIKTRYITLMTCLESLFNQGRDQITHTVSRHLALIISKTEKEFNDNYYRTKELYKLRSAIVHGDNTKEDLYKATYELQDKVRNAINFCIPLKINKKQLFDKLNTFGFGEL